MPRPHAVAVGLAVAGLAGLAAASSTTRPAAITLDGRFDDWEVEPAVVTFEVDDPRGDATGAFDVLGLAGGIDGTHLLLDLRLATPLNLQSGPEEQGTLVLDVTLPDGRLLQIDFRGRIVAVDGERTNWTQLGFEALPTYASDRQELRLALGDLGWDGEGELTIRLHGSDEIQPATVCGDPARASPAAEDQQILPARPVGDGAFRHANMNVLWDGLADAERGPRLGRLIAAADADVLTFQEAIAQNQQGQPNPVAASAGTAAVLEQRLGGRWNAVADGRGCAVVSRYPLRAVPLGDDVRGAAAIVDLPGDAIDPLVVSVHLKCCGYAGNDDDDRRVEQATAVARALQPFRDRHPIVVAGDYNLVGSSRPRDLLMGPALGLAEMIPLQRPGDSAVTWRPIRPEESFLAGRLDLILHAPELVPKTSLVVDTIDFPQAELDRLNLDAGDSGASDHLMLIADFARAAK